MAINPYKDETGKPASSKVNPKTGVSDWQKRFIIDKANKKFAKQGGAGTDKGGAFVATEMKKAAAANAAAAKKPAPKARATKRGTPVAMPTKTGSRSAVPMPTKPGNIASGLKKTATVQPKNVKKTPKPTVKPKAKSKMTPEDKAYNDLLNKYKGDITKIPGFKNGRGTR